MAGTHGVMRLSRETFTFEEKYQSFLDDLYRENGWGFERIKGKANIKSDVIIKKGNRVYLVEEKGARYLHSNMVVELVQDLDSQSWGWFYETECDYVIYVYYDGKEAIEPEYVYSVNFNLLKEYVINNIKSLKIGITTENWGITFNAYPAWTVLDNKGMLKLLYRKEIKVEVTS